MSAVGRTQQFALSGALATDGLQWILQRRRQDRRFARASFLARCMREAGVPTENALLLLDGLPDSFDRYKLATAIISPPVAWDTCARAKRLSPALNGSRAVPTSEGRAGQPPNQDTPLYVRAGTDGTYLVACAATGATLKADFKSRAGANDWLDGYLEASRVVGKLRQGRVRS
jgi:hypothetical protein